MTDGRRRSLSTPPADPSGILHWRAIDPTHRDVQKDPICRTVGADSEWRKSEDFLYIWCYQAILRRYEYREVMLLTTVGSYPILLVFNPTRRPIRAHRFILKAFRPGCSARASLRSSTRSGTIDDGENGLRVLKRGTRALPYAEVAEYLRVLDSAINAPPGRVSDNGEFSGNGDNLDG